MNSFEQHGFETPSFEGEILKEVDSLYYGIAVNQFDTMCSFQWSKDGRVYSTTASSIDITTRSLTPIKKEWYEYPENFPVIITTKNGNGIVNRANGYKIDNGKFYFTLDCTSHVAPKSEWRLATKEEVESLYYEEKE